MLLKLDTRRGKIDIDIKVTQNLKKGIVIYFLQVFNKTLKQVEFEHSSVSYGITRKIDKKKEEQELFEVYKSGKLVNDNV